MPQVSPVHQLLAEEPVHPRIGPEVTRGQKATSRNMFVAAAETMLPADTADGKTASSDSLLGAQLNDAEQADVGAERTAASTLAIVVCAFICYAMLMAPCCTI